MKTITFLFAFLLCAGMITAQEATTSSKKSCAKTCAKTCASKKSSASASATASIEGETKVASAEKAAELAASKDESIEKKVCSKTGTVSYFKKMTCEHSGATKMTEVTFDEMNNSFVSIDEAGVMSAESASEAVSVDGKSVKACCKSGEKACCAGKKKGL